MTIKINQHCLKIILQNDDFQNDTVLGETKKRGFTIDNQMLLKNIHNSAWLEYSRASLKLEFVLKIKTVAHRGRRRYCFFALGRDRLRLFNDAADEGRFRGFP